MGPPSPERPPPTLPFLELQDPQLFLLLCAHGMKGPEQLFSSGQQRLNGITESQFQQDPYILVKGPRGFRLWQEGEMHGAWLFPHLERLGVVGVYQVTCLLERAGFTEYVIWRITAWAWELRLFKKEMPYYLTGPLVPPPTQIPSKGPANSNFLGVPSKFLLWYWQLPFWVGSQKLWIHPQGTQYLFQKIQG